MMGEVDMVTVVTGCWQLPTQELVSTAPARGNLGICISSELVGRLDVLPRVLHKVKCEVVLVDYSSPWVDVMCLSRTS